jgi:outer membrane lipoprotein-sorting protein
VRLWLVCTALLLAAAMVAGCQEGGWESVSSPRSVPYKGGAGALLTSIRDAQAGIASCYLEYEIKVTEADVTRTLVGKAWVRGTQVRQEEVTTFEQPKGQAHEIRVSTGTEAWVYRPDESVVTVSPLSEETQKRVAADVSVWGPLALVVQRPVLGPQFDIQEVWSGGRKQYSIDARGWPTSASGPWSRQVTWVDADDLLVRRVEMEGTFPRDGVLVNYERTHRYWNYQPDVEMAEDVFSIALPTGTRIVRGEPI